MVVDKLVVLLLLSGTVSGNKTKLPLTITVSKDSLEDTTKNLKVEGGASGTDGALVLMGV